MKWQPHFALQQLVVIMLASFSVPVNAQEWCDTQSVWAAKARRLGRPEVVGVCPIEGNCDTPAVRDPYIPTTGTPFKAIRLHLVIFREDDGSNPATSEADIAFQLAQLNADYAPQRIRFIAGYQWVNSSVYRSLVEAEVGPMKQAHAFDPAHACNVFVTDLSGIDVNLAGRGTFPWDPVATTALGGVIMDDDVFGVGQKTLTHEMGHNLGLLHTFHGASELCHDGSDNCIPCDQPGAIASGACVCPCYERADGFEGDTTGDFAADTPPTPKNLNCIPPGGIDVCSATPEPWGPTQPENYMGYAPDSCYSLFTPQQAGRIHCWTTDELRGWLTDDWGDEFNLTASDGAADDRFGSVSISGDTAIVGAIFDEAPANNSGSAYLFVRAGSVGSQTWVQQQKLTASDGAANDWFGNSVAVSGDIAIVGAVGDDAPGVDSGSAYVFVRSGPVGSQTWTQQQKLTASDGAANDWFGFSVSISGDTAIVGARLDHAPAIDSGSAYVFVRSGGVWTQQQKLTASDGTANDWFGNSVAISGDTAIVGAVTNDAPAVQSGSAYVFVRSGGVWTQQQKLTASDGAAIDWLGWSVSISGDTAIVGAPSDDAPANNSGSAYVFVRSGGVWTQQQKLTASDGAEFDEMGNSVSISGDTAIVGAHNADAPAAASGSAYVFVRSSGVWTQQHKLTASDGAAGDLFGISVSISGDTAIIGADSDDTVAGTNSGSARCYRLLPLSAADINSDGEVNVDDLLAVITSWGSCPAPCPADVNEDGVVNVDDLLTVITNWG